MSLYADDDLWNDESGLWVASSEDNVRIVVKCRHTK